MPSNTAFLIVKNHKKIIVRQLTDLIRIGRTPDNDIILPHIRISRCHATIYFNHEKYLIVDGDLKGNVSTNGLLVNGEKVSCHTLKNHDFVSFNEKIHGFFVDPEESLKTAENSTDFFKKAFTFLSRAQIKMLIIKKLPSKKIIKTPR